MKEYQIRQMEYKDIDQLAQIEQQCFSTPWSANALKEEVGKGLFLVAVDDEDNILGYVGCQVVLDEGYITNVAVRKDACRQGVATKLLDTLEQCANALVFLTLEVRESNQTAITLYQKAGYQKVGIRKNFYRHPTENAILMTRNLKGV